MIIEEINENQIVLQRPIRAKEFDGVYYHVSTEGGEEDKIVWTPRVPLDSAWSEPEIPRICVSPTISQCLLAINFKAYDFDHFNIYKTNAKVYFPIGVTDSEITKEMWLLSSSEFIKCGELSKEQNNDIDWEEFQEILYNSYEQGWCSDKAKCITLKKYLLDLRCFFEKHNINDRP